VGAERCPKQTNSSCQLSCSENPLATDKHLRTSQAKQYLAWIVTIPCGQVRSSIFTRGARDDQDTNRAGGLAGRWVRPLASWARGRANPRLAPFRDDPQTAGVASRLHAATAAIMGRLPAEGRHPGYDTNALKLGAPFARGAPSSFWVRFLLAVHLPSAGFAGTAPGSVSSPSRWQLPARSQH
jgi:hypothetical protein